MKPPAETYYDILSVRPDASVQEITASYRSLAKILHPDVCESSDAEELFKAVNEAYQILRDPKKREEYDASLVLARSSPYSKYYQGERRYRDPRTWYYSGQNRGTARTATSPEAPPPVRAGAFPRMVQVILFYVTLGMAIFVITQLFLVPWIDGANASDARASYLQGTEWMAEEEYQKAIESYREATTRLPSFSEAWRAKGIAEIKKAEELERLGLPDAGALYRESIRSFSHVQNQQEDAGILKARATALLRTGDVRPAYSLLQTAKDGGIWDSEMESLMREVSATLIPLADQTSNPRMTPLSS